MKFDVVVDRPSEEVCLLGLRSIPMASAICCWGSLDPIKEHGGGFG